MSRGSYDRRAPSASSQIICLERLLEDEAQRNSTLLAENERLRETIREALNSNDFAARMAKEPPATDSYGINAGRLWSMKEALENNDA